MLNTERVVPVVIFLRDGAVPDRLELGGDRHIYLSFRYLACHLPRLDWQAYRDSQNLTARLNLPNMHCAPAQRIDWSASSAPYRSKFASASIRRMKSVCWSGQSGF
jgi:hypothetical protein